MPLLKISSLGSCETKTPAAAFHEMFHYQAHQRLFDMHHSCVELEHTHGAEDDPDLMFSNGNEEPHRGFGHLAFLTPDVYKASEELEKCGVAFKKKPGISYLVRISYRPSRDISPRQPNLLLR